MAKAKSDRDPKGGRPSQRHTSDSGNSGFPIHEHIGRTLKALFDEVSEQPVPERLQELMRQLEKRKTKG